MSGEFWRRSGRPLARVERRRAVLEAAGQAPLATVPARRDSPPPATTAVWARTRASPVARRPSPVARFRCLISTRPRARGASAPPSLETPRHRALPRPDDGEEASPRSGPEPHQPRGDGLPPGGPRPPDPGSRWARGGYCDASAPCGAVSPTTRASSLPTRPAMRGTGGPAREGTTLPEEQRHCE